MGGELGTWSGNAASDSMGLIPISEYSERSVCPWCLVGFGDWQVWLAGQGHLLLRNEEGKGIGFENGQFVDAFPGAMAESIDGGTGRGLEPIYTIPLSRTFTIILDGQTVTQTETVAVTRYGQGMAVAAEQVTIDPAARDEITLNADGAQMVYRSNQPKAITLSMAMDEETASHSFALRGVDIGAGESVGLEIRRAARQLVFTNQPNGAGTYQLVVTRHDPTGVKLFVHAAVEAAAQDTHYLEYSTWDGTGPMALSVDHGSDGSIDETIQLENEVTLYYLPLIGR